MADRILTIDELRAASVEINTGRLCGIYFLFDGEELIYAGKSTCYLGRLYGHISTGMISFNRVAFIPVSVELLDEAECEYIRAYRPRQNKTIPISKAERALRDRFAADLNALRDSEKAPAA